MSKVHGNIRIKIFIIFVIFVAGLILYRLFILSVIRHSGYSITAQAQSENINNILARGSIYSSDKDSNIILAATNKKFPLVYVVSSDIGVTDKDRVVRDLSQILSIMHILYEFP